MSPIDRYISERQAMEILGIKSRGGFRTRAREWGLNRFKFGRSVRYLLWQVQDRAASTRTA